MWQKRSGHENDHVDGRTGQHFICLENTATGGEHHLYIRLGAEGCAHCRRPFPKDDLDAVDPKAVIREALDMLTKNHEALLAYAEKHGVPIHTSLVSPRIPDGFRLVNAAKKMLFASRKA